MSNTPTEAVASNDELGKLYADRDHAAQGEHYMRHLDAMTREGLHAKSDIAGELAHRDIEIERLRAVADSALVYFRHYMQDEAEDEEACVCGREQHERAATLRWALQSVGLKA